MQKRRVNHKRKSIKRVRGHKKQDWHRSDFNNPYFVKYKAVNMKLYMYLLVFVSLTLFVVYFLFFSKSLLIKDVSIIGDDLGYKKQIRNITAEFLAKKKIMFLNGSNYLMFNSSKLEKELNEKMFLSSLIVDKKLSGKLDIKFEKIDPKYIWIQNNEYFTVSESGYVIGRIETNSTSHSGDSSAFNLGLIKKYLSNSDADLSRLIIYNNTEESLDLRAYVKAEVLETISQIDLNISGRIGTDILLYRINSTKLNDIEFYTEEGWVVRMNLDSVDKQLQNLYSILKTEFKDSHPGEYVDLRYGKKVYFK